ncbi:sodium:proton antiporter [Subsaximicrobium wynnwilliamsii]|uniref:Sodium:proton antiporter n=1 Tax=Subsaximicrobium wynnwilliamsii TaxID=291179 RepID=A0A5C6ZIW5_9FLAO|nr:Na+/H+ antiporter NhaC family protein [Subsaximicrobium wynnwilliamsii]TXD84212.1 sodium:proton antiporter [Subsaximicrobium wynnwilliamsii]TXD89833.1 sodium:proton antiporter [Subsaximicrobium wynnwilliamsii]TXE03924.1 sodium:proton antiporter [Subsaximicrobium wynnwilliamsii]
MEDDKNSSEFEAGGQHIVENRELNLFEALIPVVILMGMLAYNIFFVEGQEWFGTYTNQIILLLGGGVAAVVGFFNKVRFKRMLKEIWENLQSVFVPIMILFLVGALAGTWLISGVIPAMVYYGLQVLSPAIFLPASVVIAAVISIATGSSWTTSATVGIALVGIGTALGINPGMIAGAVISGAYFGDKMSPLSDTTNLAPAMAGTDLFTHIKYMAFTTVPTILITLIVFGIISASLQTTGNADISQILETIAATFNITPWLFLVPIAVVGLILLKTKPLIALGTGVVLAGIFAFVFQPEVLENVTGSKTETIVKAVLTDTNIPIDDKSYTANLNEQDREAIANNADLAPLFKEGGIEKNFSDEELAKLFSETTYDQATLDEKVDSISKLLTIDKLKQLFGSGGMEGMIWTILLICCAMVFGGIMDAIGALARVTKALLSVASSIFGLFASTVASCIGLNIVASDQYLAIVIPGKMFKKAFEDRDLAPENLSRTLEDSGTVTSVLIPWNTCGAYQSGVLGVGVGEYFFYAIFNWLSPFMTLTFAALSIKIRMRSKTNS